LWIVVAVEIVSIILATVGPARDSRSVHDGRGRTAARAKEEEAVVIDLIPVYETLALLLTWMLTLGVSIPSSLREPEIRRGVARRNGRVIVDAESMENALISWMILRYAVRYGPNPLAVESPSSRKRGYSS